MTKVWASRSWSLGRFVALLLAHLLPVAAYAATGTAGQVLDLNGHPLSQVMVTLAKLPDQSGPTAVTVFSDAGGRFQFPDSVTSGTPSARLLGYRQVDSFSKSSAHGVETVLLMRAEQNQADVAPASAWLAHAEPKDRSTLVMTCVACHQIPAPEVRAYAKIIYDTPSVEPEMAREQSWRAILRYMNYLATWEAFRSDKPPPEPGVFSVGKGDATAQLLARTLVGPMQEIRGYQYGAPVLANARTVIREYEITRPNAVREALTVDDSRIWVADESADRLIRVDADTGARRDFNLNIDKVTGFHTLVRGKDGSLWIALFHNGVIARFDPRNERWQTWTLDDGHGGVVNVHDLTFDSNHDVMADTRGRIWYSGIENNTIGWLDPKTGKSGIYAVPPVAGRTGSGLPYGVAMASDRVHVWYAQLGIGCFGSYNTETQKFETVVQLPDENSGPRRIALSDQDVLYVALFGSGQLAEYDTRKRQMIGVYDLPDRASAPYSVTWDPKRKVVWIPTANANLIYRFDPRDKSIAVLPLPREAAYLRMVAVDKRTGWLVTSYANIVEDSQGPRMAVTIDPGDGSADAATSRKSKSK